MSKTEATLPLDQMNRFNDRLRRIPEDIQDTVLIDLGEGIVGEAQFNAPVLSGHLAESHTVSEPDRGSIITGVNTPYAMSVHETHPTKARWFIEAINRNFARMARKAIVKALRERGAQ